MRTLLDVADVTRGDGRWMGGYDFNSFQCGLSSAMADVCIPGLGGQALSGTPGGSPSGFPAAIFAVVVTMRQSERCKIDDPQGLLQRSADGEISKAASRALYYGTGFSGTWLGSPEVASVAVIANDVPGTVAAALQKFMDTNVGVDPILHLGVGAAISLAFYIGDDGLLSGVDIPVVVSSSYPTGAIAVTGPIKVLVSDPQDVITHDFSVNRVEDAVTYLVSVEFDPCGAVVVGEPPIQSYVTTTAAGLATVYVVGNEVGATVNWGATAAPTIKELRNNVAGLRFASAQPFTVGDSVVVSGVGAPFDGTFTLVATTATVTNKALTANVATLTTSAAHPFEVGDTITVSGVDAVFNGTYVVTTVPTATTFSYAKVNADVTSAASGGAVAGDTTKTIRYAVTNANLVPGVATGSVASAPTTYPPATGSITHTYNAPGSYPVSVVYAGTTRSFTIKV
jgi:hypothetical protein